jgi:hypothetical protein
MRRIILTAIFIIFIFQNTSFGEKTIAIDYSALKISQRLRDTAFSDTTKLSIPHTIAQSLLLPAYGSYKSESYILSSLQMCLDLAPVFLLVTSDWRGEKSMGLMFLPAFWAVNRVLAVPLNGFAAFAHNYRIDHKKPVRFLPTFSDKSHLGLVMVLGSDYSIPIYNFGFIPGILIKTGPIRATISIPNIQSSDEYDRVFYGSPYDGVKYRSGSHLTATVDYRFRFHKCICINPGVTADIFKSSYAYYHLVGNQEVPLRNFTKTSYLIGPKVSFEITRFNRFTIEHTIFLPVAVERNFSSYNKEIDRIMPFMNYTISINALIF